MSDKHRTRPDAIEFAEGSALVAVGGMEDSVALDDLGDRLDQVVEEEVIVAAVCDRRGE